MRSTMRNRVPKTIKSPRSEEGFAIPIALGMGLIMILLATTAMVRSQDDRVTSINTKDSARSELAAKSGVAQIQAFMNRYRSVAYFPACVGTWNSDGTCSDAATVNSWANTARLPASLNAACTTEASLSTAQGTVQNWASAAWKEVDPLDTETDQTKRKGQFRLLRYSFDDTSSTNQFGDLTVEGRVNGGQSNEAITQVKVKFGIFAPDQIVAPLWVTNTGSNAVSGTPQINGDVLRPCGSTTAVTYPSGSSYKTIQSRSTIPANVSAPTAGTYYTLPNISGIAGQELPRPGDSPDDGVYKYIVTSFDESLKISAGQRVSLWVDGSLDLSDRVIVNQCGTDDACTPFDVRIYGTSGTLTLNPSTRICDVLFHMPNYDVVSSTTDAANTTQNCGDVTNAAGDVVYRKKNTGVYWVNSWAASGSGIVIDTPRVKWTHVDVPAQVLPPPVLGPDTSEEL
jgi:Tfp pilus assembly protein PilX